VPERLGSTTVGGVVGDGVTVGVGVAVGVTVGVGVLVGTTVGVAVGVGVAVAAAIAVGRDNQWRVTPAVFVAETRTAANLPTCAAVHVTEFVVEPAAAQSESLAGPDDETAVGQVYQS
jgi:hypothetical protein